MARTIGKLSPAAVRAASKPGLYGDGAGLYLRVGPTGGKAWAFRYMLNGRAREMGLGPLHTIGLAEAREMAREARRLKLAGLDPLTERRQASQRRAGDGIPFRRAAEAFIADNRAAWRNEKHAWQWGQTLAAHVYPVIGEISVRAIETGHVTQILRSLWLDRAETASRIRGRIESILDYAKAQGWREGENPARWKGHLNKILPARRKVAATEHYSALPWREIGAFMAALAERRGGAALALRFAVLTAARTGEVIGARWSEIDLAAGLWAIPASRMKTGKEHRVPLSDAALDVLHQAAAWRRGDDDAFIFPGGAGARGLSNMAMLRLLRRMGRADLTVHGFRSTFRDWVAEATGFPRELAEAALAHVLGSAVEAAYQRGDMLDRRRRLMADWAAFCSRPAPIAGDVVPLRA